MPFRESLKIIKISIKIHPTHVAGICDLQLHRGYTLMCRDVMSGSLFGLSSINGTSVCPLKIQIESSLWYSFERWQALSPPSKNHHWIKGSLMHPFCFHSYFSSLICDYQKKGSRIDYRMNRTRLSTQINRNACITEHWSFFETRVLYNVRYGLRHLRIRLQPFGSLQKR